MELSASVSNTNSTNRLCFAGLTIGSGFYSLFSVTEEPFVTSGGLSIIQYQFMYLIKLRRSMDGFLLEGQEGPSEYYCVLLAGVLANKSLSSLPAGGCARVPTATRGQPSRWSFASLLPYHSPLTSRDSLHHRSLLCVICLMSAFSWTTSDCPDSRKLLVLLHWWKSPGDFGH